MGLISWGYQSLGSVAKTSKKGRPFIKELSHCLLVQFIIVYRISPWHKSLTSSRSIHIYPPPKTNRTQPLNMCRGPKGDDRIPTIHFKGYVSFREGNFGSPAYSSFSPWESFHPPKSQRCIPFKTNIRNIRHHL